jgi:DNA-binding transcriptional regulator YbjK
MLEVAQLRAEVAALSRRRRGPETTADLLVDLLVGSESDHLTEQLISRYERYIACARQPALRDIQRRNLHHRIDAISEVIERSGRSVRLELVSALICAVDGAVVSALVDDQEDPRAVARATVIDVIDSLAPFDQRTVEI